MIEELAALFTIEQNIIITLAFFTVVIIIYSVFIYHFYRFLAKKNIIELNLNQYNQYSNPTIIKIFAAFFYIIEYIVLLPILTFFWFSILAILMLLLAKGLTVKEILLIAAALVAAVRAISYVSEDLAKDLAKMLPFTFLAITITTAGFFDIAVFFESIAEIPTLFAEIPYYLLFIVGTELLMRIVEFIHSSITPSSITEDNEIYE